MKECEHHKIVCKRMKAIESLAMVHVWAYQNAMLRHVCVYLVAPFVGPGFGTLLGFVGFSIIVHYVDFYIASFTGVVVTYCDCFLIITSISDASGPLGATLDRLCNGWPTCNNPKMVKTPTTSPHKGNVLMVFEARL